MILSAVIPRWWNVTSAQLHWVGMHMAYAETLLAESALMRTAGAQVVAALERYAPPGRAQEDGAPAGRGRRARRAWRTSCRRRCTCWRTNWPPAITTRRWPPTSAAWPRKHPDSVSPRAISRTFGTPKPTLANSYQPELLNLRTFPTLMGYSSRILAESWESNLLYYARAGR